MADITQKSMDTLFSLNVSEASEWNLNPAEEMHKRQVIIADGGETSKAAFVDIYPFMGNFARNRALRVLSFSGKADATVKSLTKDQYNTRRGKIVEAINRTLPSIIEDGRHKKWHADLVEKVMDRLVYFGLDKKSYTQETALPEALNLLYGNFTVWKTNAPFNVAFPKQKIDDAGLNEEDWIDAQEHFFFMLHQKYGGKISFVPRGEILSELKKEDIALPKWTPYAKSNYEKNKKGKLRFDMKAMGTNKYNAQWNAIQKRIQTDGSSIKVGFINSGGDPNKIQGIITEFMRDGSSRVIGDIFGVEYDSSNPDFGHFVPASFSVDNTITMMKSRQAWQKANSGDDVLPGLLDVPIIGGVWDGLDPITAFGRFLQSSFGFEPTFGTPGGDFGREAILEQYKWTRGHWEKENGRKYRDWPSTEIGPDGNYGDSNKEGKGYASLAPNTYGGKYFTEVFAPGQVENDLFFQPLGEELMEEEKRLGRKLTDRETWELYQVVKGRLNGKEDFWSGMLDNRVTDMLFQGKAWNDPEEDNTPRTLFDAYVLNGGKMFTPPPSDTPIADFFGRAIKRYGGEDSKLYYDLWRTLTFPSALQYKNTNLFK